MASIEITDNTVIRSLIRKGSNSDREEITLASGELGFSTDTGRVFVGNGTDQGGTAEGDYLVVGNKFLGEVSSFGNANALPGDLFKFNGNLYARKTDYGGNAADSSGYNLIGTSLSAGAGLKIANEQISVKIDSSGTLQFDTDGALTVGTITLNDMPTMDSNSLLGNFTGGSAKPQISQVEANSVMGRTSTATLGSVTYDDILFNADGTGRATGKPTVSGITVADLAGSGTSAVVCNSNGTLERPDTSGANILTQWVYYDVPYQIFGATTASGGSYTANARNAVNISSSDSPLLINPWTSADPGSPLSVPAGVKAAIIFGTTDTTTFPIRGLTRGNGPRSFADKRNFTIYATKTATVNTCFNPIFSCGAGEEDDGKPETNAGGGTGTVFLNSSGNFYLGLYANYTKSAAPVTDSMNFKLYLLGYAL